MVHLLVASRRPDGRLLYRMIAMRDTSTIDIALLRDL